MTSADHPRHAAGHACHPAAMRREVRALVAAALGFVVWRIAVELVPIPVALVLGLAVGGATWLLTAPRTG